MKRLFLAGALCALSLSAVETRSWVQEDQSDFEKGTLKKLSLRSDGRLMLAPTLKQLFDPSAAYLWSVVQDSKGNLYTGGGGYGGSKAKIFQITPAGQGRTLAEIEGLEIHSLAVNRSDQLFAATSPDSKVYRIDANGKPALFFDPKAKYVWAMAFDSKGNLFVATGDEGIVYKVTPNGQGSAFFRTEETHARSLAIDAQDNLILGTEPSGLILRIDPSGTGFVVHQAGKREVTAVAVRPDGVIYAAAIGTKPTAPAPAAPSTVPITTPTPATSNPGAPPAPTARPTAPGNSSLVVGGASVPGGSEVYRIEKDGYVRKVWSQATDIAYAIAFDAQGRPLIGTGNKGNIYRLDSDVLSTLLINAVPTQVTSFASGRNGEVYAVTGNAGMVYQIGPGLERQGTYDSEVFDAGSFSYWGRVTYKTDPARGSGVTLTARSGNLDRPQKNWSNWTAVNAADGDGGRLTAPPARFVQYRATLAATGEGRSPELTYVELAYLPKNVPPLITVVEKTPTNYRYTPSILTLTPPAKTVSLPAVGQKRRSTTSPLSSIDTGDTLSYAKGWVGVRWAANDENGDELVYSVEIRGEQERDWKLLKDNVKERHYSWDSTAFPDGEYRVRITASDQPGNPPGQALTAHLEGDVFTIDNTPPQITNLTATAASGNKLTLRWHAQDAASTIDKAEYSINGGEWRLAEPITKLSDSRAEDYNITADRAGATGEQTIAIRVTDEYDNVTTAKTVVR